MTQAVTLPPPTRGGWALQYLPTPRCASSSISLGLRELRGALVDERGPHGYPPPQPPAGVQVLRFTVVRPVREYLLRWWLRTHEGRGLVEWLESYTHADFYRGDRLFYYVPWCALVLELSNRTSDQVRQLCRMGGWPVTRISRHNATDWAAVRKRAPEPPNWTMAAEAAARARWPEEVRGERDLAGAAS